MENDIFCYGVKQTTKGLVLIYLMFAREEMRLNHNINDSTNETRLTQHFAGKLQLFNRFIPYHFTRNCPMIPTNFADDLIFYSLFSN